MFPFMSLIVLVFNISSEFDWLAIHTAFSILIDPDLMAKWSTV